MLAVRRQRCDARRGSASTVEGAVMLARGRVGADYTTGCLRIAARGHDTGISSATTLRAVRGLDGDDDGGRTDRVE